MTQEVTQADLQAALTEAAIEIANLKLVNASLRRQLLQAQENGVRPMNRAERRRAEKEEKDATE